MVDLGAEPALVERYGSREMLTALDRAEESFGTESEDVCRLLGGAWIGEEAVACALWCVVRAGGGYREAVLRGANSSGDSDSIACIAGGIAGALGGIASLPDEWVREVEAAPRLDALARLLHHTLVTASDEETPPAELDFFGVESHLRPCSAVEQESPTREAPGPADSSDEEAPPRRGDQLRLF